MISSNLKKVASSHGLQVNHGIAYGQIRGYAVTLSEGNNYRRIDIITTVSDPQCLESLQNLLQDSNRTAEYLIQKVDFTPKHIVITFRNTMGSMKGFTAFIAWFFPLLDHFSATKTNTCPECGCDLSSGCWKLANGSAYYVHPSCGDRIRRRMEAEAEACNLQSPKSYGAGVVGALLGALLGAIVWALVLHIGYIAVAVGLLVGYLAERGYTLLKGKPGKAKPFIIGIAVVLAVVLGTFLSETHILARVIRGAPYASLQYFLYMPRLLFSLMQTDPLYRADILTNLGLGLLFGLLGAFNVMKRSSSEAYDGKVIDLP